jgi:hypothetical protein
MTRSDGLRALRAGMDNTPEEAGAVGELLDRIRLMEEAYEFFLAYAAQGLRSDADGGAGAEVRGYLNRLDEGIDGLDELVTRAAEERGLEPMERFRDFAQVMGEDASRAGATLRLVASRPSISSELVDNLNATIHLRALLLDLFVLGEILEES